MSEARYTREHEWVRRDGEVATLGISDYAQQQLGDIVFVELPEVGRQVKQGDPMAVVESVKAASDVYAPVSGEVVEANQALADDPATVNRAAEGDGWFCKIRLSSPAELDQLMSADDYQAFIGTLS